MGYEQSLDGTGAAAVRGKVTSGAGSDLEVFGETLANEKVFDCDAKIDLDGSPNPLQRARRMVVEGTTVHAVESSESFDQRLHGRFVGGSGELDKEHRRADRVQSGEVPGYLPL